MSFSGDVCIVVVVVLTQQQATFTLFHHTIEERSNTEKNEKAEPKQLRSASLCSVDNLVAATMHTSVASLTQVAGVVLPPTVIPPTRPKQP